MKKKYHMKNYIINYNGNKFCVFFNTKSPLSGVKQFFKSNYTDLFNKYIEKNKSGQTFIDFLNEIDCKLEVVDFYDYSIVKQ
jgi:hypothetical protein